jgi:hypothetical protein
MAIDGRLTGQPANAAVSGDVRANENMALTAVHTLFVREHNRIVSSLPRGLTEEQKFQIARRVVGAEQQYVTYNEFLPALGVRLPRYRGYRPDVNASIGNEFATVAYRAHSMIHGEFELSADAADYSPADLARLEGMGVEVAHDGAELELTVPLGVAFFNPDLVPDIGLGPILAGLSAEPQYKNDEQIDNSLRSVLFEVPGNETGIVDLGALDVQRGRDHGMPTYNQMRRAYGLAPRRSFTAITGERTEQFPAGSGIDDPASLDFTALFDSNGAPIAFGSDAAVDSARVGLRRTSLAARLKGIYGSVDDVDAFVGMISEPHVRGSEFGPLQLAMWRRQFEALRDGDRFFYARDPVLRRIQRRYGITYAHPLSWLIATDGEVARADIPANVFFAPGAQVGAPPPPHRHGHGHHRGPRRGPPGRT